MARPTKFTDKIADEFCELIASGKSLQRAAYDIGVTPTTVYNWLAAHQKFSTLYRQARIVQVALTLDQLAEMEEQVVDKQIEASAFRAMLDSRKWRIGQISQLYAASGDPDTENAIDVAAEFKKRMERLRGKKK